MRLNCFHLWISPSIVVNLDFLNKLENYDKIVIAEIPEEERKKKEKARKQMTTPGGSKLKKQKKIKARYSGTVSDAMTSCTVSLLGKNLTFDVQGFFQSNLGLLEKAIPLIIEGLEGKNVLVGV